MDPLILGFVGMPVWSRGLVAVPAGALPGVDLGVSQRKSHAIGVRDGLLRSAGQVTLGLLFAHSPRQRRRHPRAASAASAPAAPG